MTGPRVELGALHLGALLVEVARFARLSVSGFSLALPLVGAAAVSAALTPLQVAGLVAVGLAFHVFGYVSNDVIDLPIDRTQPLRHADPLVRGAIGRRQALAFACLQPAFTVPLITCATVPSSRSITSTTAAPPSVPVSNGCPPEVG